MIKAVYAPRVQTDIGRDGFYRHWRTEHTDKRAFAAILGARRYVQNHTIDVPANQNPVQSRRVGS